MVLCLIVALCGCAPDEEDSTPTTTTTTVPTTTTTTGTPTTFFAAGTDELAVSSPNGVRPDAEALERLAAICKAHRGSLSIYYKDLENGYILTYDATRTYQAASVIKAPYVKWLLESGVDQTEKLTLTSKKGGSFHIDAFPKGTQFTVGELMEYAVRYSDNSAYNMLNERFKFAGFTDYGDRLGVVANRNNKLTLVYPKPRFGYLCALDIGLYFEDIARFIDEGTEAGKQLFSWLITTIDQQQLPDAFPNRKQYVLEEVESETDGDAADSPILLTTPEALDQAFANRLQGYTIGHKYGEQGSQAYHDGAIVWRDHPYVLAITSTLTPYEEDSLQVFHDIAALVDQLQTAFYS